MGLAGFTTKGNLSSFNDRIAQRIEMLPRTENESDPSSAMPTPSLRMMAMYIDGRIRRERLDSNSEVTPTMRTNQTYQDSELIKWKTVEMFKASLPSNS